MLQIQQFSFNILGTNCYVIYGGAEGRCVVADPGMYRPYEKEQLFDFLSQNGLVPDGILLTHGHFDHVWGVAAVLERFPGCPVYLSVRDEEVLLSGEQSIRSFGLKNGLELFPRSDAPDGLELSLAGFRWQAIATPGHTPGGTCWWCPDERLLLSGDTLFAGTIGRSDLPGGDYDALIRSILERLMDLPGDTQLLPGHGHASSIGREAMTNPFLLPFNEPDPDWSSLEPLR